LAASKRWKARNAEQVTAYRREYDSDLQHREENKERARRFRERNGEAVTIYRRELYATRQQAGNTARVAAYRAANPGKHPEVENRRRARLLGQFVAVVDPEAIRLRDRGMCGICGHVVASDQESLDHILPLALGGTHEPANVQLAHRVCNSRKGAKAPVAA
jgi:5-methylcytosine-specific restriction endonuclease McrA